MWALGARLGAMAATLRLTWGAYMAPALALPPQVTCSSQGFELQRRQDEASPW